MIGEMHPLYRDAVLAHNRSPRRYGVLESPSHAHEARNARCGDVLRWTLRLEDGRIEDCAFTAEACAVTVATASMLAGRAAGTSPGDVARWRAEVLALVEGRRAEALGELGEFATLAELEHQPARRDCARLAFDAMLAACDDASRIDP